MMRNICVHRCVLVVLVGWSLGTVGVTSAQETVGNPLVPGRGGVDTDTAAGAIFVDLDGFTMPGILSTFGFFNDDTGQFANSLTPLIFQRVGTDFLIRGVGQTVTNASTGAQTFPFVLTEGSAAVGPDFFFGYKNGADAEDNQPGIIEFNLLDGAPSERFFGERFQNNLDPGVNLGPGTFIGDEIGQVERVYSVQATSIVPEPATLGVVTVLAGTMTLRRRHR